MELRYKKISWKGGSHSPLFAILLFPKEKLSESGDMRQVIDGKQKERGFFKKKEREQYAFGNELGT